jgi:hypothetical protein
MLVMPGPRQPGPQLKTTLDKPDETVSGYLRSLVRVSTAVLVFACAALLSFAGRGKAPDFPHEAFQANEEVARWLLVYDWIAWRSSDLVMQESEEDRSKLGSEWFCFESDGTWHAVYGRYERQENTYTLVFHYVYDGDTGFARTTDPIAQELLTTYGRAIRNGLDQLPDDVKSLGVRFNTYIRSVDTVGLEVWILPAGQPDGTLVFGGDIRYVFDPTGTELLDEDLSFSGFHAATPDEALRLDIDRQENEVPSVGDIFFLLTFRDQFEHVTVWNRCFLTTMLDVGGQETAWLHAERQTAECIKKKRPKRQSKKNKH